MKPEEIAALQENELRAHAPNLVKKIEDSAKEPLETKVSEMTDASTAVKPTLDLIPSLREILGLDDKADDLSVLQAAVTSIKEQGKKLRDTVLDSVLEKKFKGKDSTLLRRVIVGEITSKNLTLTGDETKDEQTVTEMVNTIINGDEKLKEIVSEMEGTPASPPGAPPPAPGTPDYKAGSETSTLRVRSLA